MMMQQPRGRRATSARWYEIEWQQFSGTALGVQGLAAGTLDCATVGGLSVANGIDQGADIVILGEFIEERSPYFSTAWMVRKDSGHRLARRPARQDGRHQRRRRLDRLPAGLLHRAAGGPEAGPRLREGRGPVRPDAGDAALRPRRHGPVPAAVLRRDQRHRRRQADVPRSPTRSTRSSSCSTAAGATSSTRTRRPCGGSRRTGRRVARLDRRSGQPRRGVARERGGDQDPRRRARQASCSPSRTTTGPPNGALNVDALQEEWDFFRDRGGIKQDLKVSDHVIDDLLPPDGGSG